MLQLIGVIKMNEEQINVNQLRELLLNLSCDTMALAVFCRCQNDCVSEYGTETALSYVRRTQKTIYGDISRIIELTDHLTDSALSTLQQ